MKRVMVVGSAGQDGRLLAERLRADGCEILGIARDGAGPDLTHCEEVAAAVRAFVPEEVYYLAAFHHSSQDRQATDTHALLERSFAVNTAGVVNFLEAIKTHAPQARLFYAASSLVFGEPPAQVQDERTPLAPRCAYGISKAAGLQCCQLYRRTHGVFAATGILYNHESPYRAEKFVSRKIIRGALRIERGQQEKLVLGDLSARIDWGYAPDFVEAMTRILALPEADDFIVATGQTHSVQEFVETAFGLLGLDWREHVVEDPSLLGRRKAPLAGDAGKLRAQTGWQPSVPFEQMIALLVEAERHAS